jgi:hypothetical protein
MAAPVITNQAPEPQVLGSVKAPIRFSVRAQDVTVNRDSLQCYVGESYTFYRGADLPENLDYPSMLFQPLSGSPTEHAARAITPSGLKIWKNLPNTQQVGTYFFGSLESPADPSDALMVEFTLSLSQIDVGNIGVDEFTGVLVGLLAGITGVTVRFFTTGTVRRIELWGAGQAEIGPPSSYSALFDWDLLEHTYKLLWYPQKDLVKLYVSTGQKSLTSDVLLISGLVSDIPVVPPSERLTQLPWVYFGHGYPGPTSISYWKDVFLYNQVFNPIVNGLPVSGYKGLVESDNLQSYQPTQLPIFVDRAWTNDPVISLVGDKTEYLEKDKLVMQKLSKTARFGYLRTEPGLALAPSIVDFKISGEQLLSDPDSASTGMELFLNTGARVCTFSLLYFTDQQYIGIMRNAGYPKLSNSYTVRAQGWGSEGFYRLFNDGTWVRLIQLADLGNGVEETELLRVALTSLPLSTTSPSVGFLQNSLSGESISLLRLGLIRYVTMLKEYRSTVVYPAPPALPIITPDLPWVATTPSELSPEGFDTVITNTISASTIYRNDTEITHSSGITLEFRSKVMAYGVDSPLNAITGVGVSVDDGTYRTELMFADAGPVLGKVVFFTTRDTYDNLLLDIITGGVKTQGTFGQVDWSQFHLYRIEKTIGGTLQLFVDESNTPMISVDTQKFKYPNTRGTKQVSFGCLLDNSPSISQWTHVRYSVSTGLDVSIIRPEVTDKSRFDMAVNTIVEAEAP